MVTYHYVKFYVSIIIQFSPFFPWTMNLSTADLRNYWTEFHETWWSYRYMFLVDPKVFRFVVKGVKAIFLGVQNNNKKRSKNNKSPNFVITNVVPRTPRHEPDWNSYSSGDMH
jgi:hypothetical protein